MKKNNFVEGTIIATIAIVFVKILGMLYVIPFYSIVGSQGGALYSYSYNIYLIFLGISSAGLPDAIAKIISEYNALGYDDAKKRAYTIGKKMIGYISVIAFVILFVFSEEIGKFIIGDLEGGNTASDVAFTIRCIAPAILMIPYLSITKGYLQGHKYISPSSMSQLIEQIVRISVILIGSYLTLKVFNGTISLAIGISCFGAFLGGLVAYIYLKRSIKKANLEKQEDANQNETITDKEILSKIIKYAIPFVIINIVSQLYNFTDQILVLRTLEYLNYSSENVEFIASSISTWSPKICMIINAMAMGMTMSLVPTIVSEFAKKNKTEVANKINKALSMIIFISLPLSLGLCILSTSVWTIFYNTNSYGPMILRLMVFSALFGNLYLIISTICQSLNKYKLVYKISITGFFINALLDVPIMLLYNYIGIPAFLGSTTASIIGYSTSVFIGLYNLKKENNISYKTTFNNILKTLVPALSMVVILLIINYFIKFNELTISGAMITIIMNTVIGGIIYVGVSYKTGLINELLGKAMVNKIIKKLTFGKISID